MTVTTVKMRWEKRQTKVLFENAEKEHFLNIAFHLGKKKIYLYVYMCVFIYIYIYISRQLA